MTTLDKNVWDSLDKVHLCVDALLQRTTTFPKVNVQTTPVSGSDLTLAAAAAAASGLALALALAPESQPALPPTPTPRLVPARDPIQALDPTPATGSTPAPPPAPFQSSACVHGQELAPHLFHPLFPNANGQVDSHAPDNLAQPPPNMSRCTPTQPPRNLYQGTRVVLSVTERWGHSWCGTQGPRIHGNPLVVDVDEDFNNDKDRPLGSQIVSPRHWDCRQLACKTGHSPLDAAALGCQEYHGYERGYMRLITEIIYHCGYRNLTGAGVILCFNGIILMHRRVMDMWVNPCMMQSGPSVERILDKGLVMFPKLASMDVAVAVEFYNQLQKTLALFLLPFMLFDVVNLHMGFKSLCPPGLGLPWYVEIAGVMMEVIPHLLPAYDSQVTL
jgi:hypothetical protein